jgi:hypothetical protein
VCSAWRQACQPGFPSVKSMAKVPGGRSLVACFYILMESMNVLSLLYNDEFIKLPEASFLQVAPRLAVLHVSFGSVS